MDKVIFFNRDSKEGFCTGNKYLNFIDYAFGKTDSFMLVYINYYAKGYSKTQKYFRDKLKRFKIKSRTDPNWPGIMELYGDSTSYKVVFYKNSEETKNILKEAKGLNDWSGRGPENLAFFIGNQCWFYSVSCENIAAVVHASEEDIAFLVSQNLAKREAAFIPKNNYIDTFDEPGLLEKHCKFKAN